MLFCVLLGLCVGNLPGTGVFPSQRQEMQSFDDIVFSAWLDLFKEYRIAGEIIHPAAHVTSL